MKNNKNNKNNKHKQLQKIKRYLPNINLQKNKFNTIELILVFIMALTFGLLLGEIIFKNGTSLSLTQKSTPNLTEIENVYNTLSEEYINKVSKEELKEAAIKGMISLLGDQHSVYYDKETKEELEEELNGYFYGLGAGIIQEEGKLITIKEIYENSPAEQAGLKEGDQYLKINGEDVTKLNAEEISKKIKGTKNKTINLTVKRGNKEKEIKVTTGKVEIPSVKKEILTTKKQKVGYLQISVFASNTDEQLKRKLAELDKENIKELIIDLRYNEGGHLDTVLNIANEFIDKKQPIIQIISKNKKEIKYSNKNNDKKYKIVVLINEGSASASEVLASALNEQLNAPLIGKTTYGKGTVQKTKTLPSGGVIKYTIETWKTSKGKEINKKGIKPTIEIEQNEKYYTTYSKKDDNQLKKALETIAK